MESEVKPHLVLSESLKSLGLVLDDRKQMLLLDYCGLLLEGLSKQRLTGEDNLEDLIRRQIYDCLFPITKIAFENGSRIVDLGSGGGVAGYSAGYLFAGMQGISS